MTIAGTIMVAALWAAAIYRIGLSIRLPATVWRTAFTVTSISVAAGATFQVIGPAVDHQLEVWNLSTMLTPAALTVTCVSTSIYVRTLRQTDFPAGAVAIRLCVGAAVLAVETVTWLLAPVHGIQLTSFAVVWRYPSWLVFNGIFAVAIVLCSIDVASFCLRRVFRRGDLVSAISLAMTGTACAAGALVFAVEGGVVVSRFITGADVPVLTAIFSASIPPIMVLLAAGTISLLIGPPIADTFRQARTWWTLRPLWHDLIEAAPTVHLNRIPAGGGPRRRLAFRVQRMRVEISDALRVLRVHTVRDAGIPELAAALRSPTVTGQIAADVFSRSESIDEGLIALARTYRRHNDPDPTSPGPSTRRRPHRSAQR